MARSRDKAAVCSGQVEKQRLDERKLQESSKVLVMF